MSKGKDDRYSAASEEIATAEAAFEAESRKYWSSKGVLVDKPHDRKAWERLDKLWNEVEKAHRRRRQLLDELRPK